MLRVVPILIMLSGCVTSSVVPKKYIHWVNNPNNGLTAHNVVGDYEFSLQFLPLEYVAFRELKEEKISRNELEEQKSEMAEFQYYVLRIKAANGTDVLKHAVNGVEEYYHRLEYFSSSMQADIYMEQGANTLPCQLFHFERTYGVSPYQTFVLGFPNGDGQFADRTLIFSDKVLGVNTIQLRINGGSLKKIPSVKLKK